MGFFSKLGEIVITLFNLLGTLILELVKLPKKIKSEDILEKISRIKYEARTLKSPKVKGIRGEGEDSPVETVSSGIGASFDPSEKENTVLRLQVAAAGFIITSILYAFNIIPLLIFLMVGVLLIILIIYILYYRVRLMYPQDFNAYRDFFLMYIAVGFLVIIVANNPLIYSLFSFMLLPSLGVLIFALIAVATIFIVFRIRYHREYTFGEVIEAGENTSQVRVDYDIRSNVKPDIYIVENNKFKVKEHDIVKLAIESSWGGNKPKKIIGKK
ncbi:MAG TPA: DUF2101 family protein [Methanothermobacter sp.]|uniref:DUF2101 domain-containing protein n=1 Tax=Methanothermobacter tenebrarum TaxID=680118 RepID=A0ABN6PAX2_9EURY|nr:DUF2101 family protein [Methanothermobacter tenebrarum]MDI6881656.1 DUF2101 family protein [Methanothermobacter sp.]BDH79372.1 hypothetical protein MTTB_07510 [Methanothermobacter tenebrarum]HHW16106.1 DUF2101 family protein [Methanothermobacter sp.]